jgi:hypothetical protein
MGYRLPNPQWEGNRRTCCKCGLVDSPVYIGEANEQGEPIFEHRVILDLTYTKTELLTAKDKADGWLSLKVENRPAKMRTICRDCLEAVEATDAVWKDFDKARADLEDKKKEKSWYSQLCEG